jgi:putative membrane protein
MMLKPLKRIILGILVNTTAIWFAARVLPGFGYHRRVGVLVSAAVVLWLLDTLIKPVLKIILLPINLATLGLFSWLSSAAVVYLLSLVVDEVSISATDLPGFSYAGFITPPIHLNLLGVTVLTAFLIRAANSFLYWLIK